MIKAFTKDKSDFLKGIFAILILLCHLLNRTGIGTSIGLGPIYTALGYWGVSIYLFISGYGLAACVNNRQDYLNRFLYDKVLRLYKIQFIYIIAYTFFRAILTPKITLLHVLQSFLFGKTIIMHGWYLQVILLFYLAFYVVYKIIQKDNMRIFSMFLVILVYMFIARYLGLSSTWYECSLCFPLGLLCYQLPQNAKARYCYPIILLISFAFFTSSYLLYYYYISHEISIFYKVISSVSFSLFIIYLSNFICFNNKITTWLSSHYLEIYLLQGLAFIFLRNRYWTIENNYLFFLLAIVVTVVLAYFVKRLSLDFNPYKTS